MFFLAETRLQSDPLTFDLEIHNKKIQLVWHRIDTCMTARPSFVTQSKMATKACKKAVMTWHLRSIAAGHRKTHGTQKNDVNSVRSIKRNDSTILARFNISSLRQHC